MAQIPKLWSKLEDAGDVISPQLGTGGAECNSPTYLPAKFGNGIFTDAMYEGCAFPTSPNEINLNKGAIEFWAKPNFDPDYAANRALFDFREPGHGGLDLTFNMYYDTFALRVFSEGVVKVTLKANGLSWSAGDLLHFGIAWDREGNDIGNSKTLILKVDNVEFASSTTKWNADTVNSNLYIGTDYTPIVHSQTVMDNLKTYDVCKTDFSDRETEGVAPPAGQPFALRKRGRIIPSLRS